VPRLDSRRAGPADAGERVGRISEGSIHPASGKKNSANFAITEF
jgi:hypothetical protein